MRKRKRHRKKDQKTMVKIIPVIMVAHNGRKFIIGGRKT